jgi:hypothetical protein
MQYNSRPAHLPALKIKIKVAVWFVIYSTLCGILVQRFYDMERPVLSRTPHMKNKITLLFCDVIARYYLWYNSSNYDLLVDNIVMCST